MRGQSWIADWTVLCPSCDRGMEPIVVRGGPYLECPHCLASMHADEAFPVRINLRASFVGGHAAANYELRKEAHDGRGDRSPGRR